MIFEVTSDNSPYLEARGHLVLNACPGSGKTSAIAYKLKTLTKECLAAYGDYSGIACLSFTNVAKDEIAQKFEQISGGRLGYPHLTSTIDSFINQFITLPYYYLFNTATKRPTVMDHVGFLDEMNLGWFQSKRGKMPVKLLYPPSKLKIQLDGTYTWNGYLPDHANVDAKVFENYAKKFKEWQHENGYLNNDDSTYYALKLLETYPEIAVSLARRFPYIIVDEAQDTSEIQYKILDILIKAGLSNVELVGDPYQSLYEFREAEPEMFLARFDDVKNWQPLRFDFCRRSSQRIVDAYSLFRNDKESTITAVGAHSTDHNLKIIRYDSENLQNLIDRYESLIDPAQTNYILVRGAKHLEMFGVKTSSEEPWKNRMARLLIDAQVHFSKGGCKASIDLAREFVADINTAGANYRAKKDEVSRLKEDTDLNMVLFDFMINMPSIDDTLTDWTTNVTAYIKAFFGKDVDLELKKKGKVYISQNLKAVLYPPMTTPYPVSTIHKVKGMTFNSVLVVLSEDSRGGNFSLKNFSKPADLPDEKQRMLYVALSRPETLACIAVPNTFTEDAIRSHLGLDLDFIP